MMPLSRGLRLPGSGTSNATTPDTAKFTPATSIEVRAIAAADDWTPAAAQAIAEHSMFTSDVGWALFLMNTGQVQFQWSPTGAQAALITRTATQTPTATNGYSRGLGARLVLATGVVTFLHSIDGLTWTEFETATPAGATTVFNSTQPLTVGGGPFAWFAGVLRRFELRVDNRIVADPRFDEQAPGTTVFDDSRGNRWTLGAAASIEKNTAFAPTTTQILDLDGVHRRKDGFRFELCDRDYHPIGELHPDRTGSVPSIENDTDNTTPRRLRGLRLLPDEAGDVNTVRDRLRVYMVLQNGIEYRLGTFLWGDDNRPLRSWGEQHDADLVDPTYILNQQSTQAFGWGRGADVALTWLFLVYRAGFTLDDLYVHPAGLKGTLAEPKSWQPGATWVQMLTDLGDLQGLVPPWSDRDGLIHHHELPDPDLTSPTIPPYDDGTRVVADSIMYSNGLLAAPNDFAVFDTGTDRLRLGRFQVPASAPHSFANRGFRVGLVESVAGLETQAQADAAARQLARRSGGVLEWLTFDSTADPRHDTYDVIEAFGSRWLETAWSLELRSGGRMSHTMRRVTYAS